MGSRALTLLLLGMTAWVWTIAAGPAPAQGASADRGAPHAIVLSLDGAVGPASADYLVGGIARAVEAGAQAIVLRIDTPGGLDTSMREIVRAILSSELPVLGWVGPDGARAASAGTFILLACHVAAMAPATNLGAATPIPLFGKSPSSPQQPTDGVPRDGGAGGQVGAQGAGQDGGAKAVNDAVAFARSLAALRGRNADWAERAVRDAASLPAGEARDAGVVDFVAADLGELFAKADGRRVRVGNRDVVLDTDALVPVDAEPSWKHRVLAAISNPNVALILLMLGAYGLLLEFLSPGVLVPGTVGGIMLLLGLYSLAALPLNLAGVALLLLGFALLVAEAFVPSFGVLGIGGAVAFLFGATMLVDGGGVPGFEVAWPLAAGMAAAALLLGVIVARVAAGSLGRPVRAGQDAMIGQVAEVIDWQADAGHVFFHGERWRAISEHPRDAIAPYVHGEPVQIVALDGLTLRVRPAEPQPGRQRSAGSPPATRSSIHTVPPR